MRSALASAFVDSLPSAFLFMINSGYLGRWAEWARTRLQPLGPTIITNQLVL